MQRFDESGNFVNLPIVEDNEIFDFKESN
jgi:hypothetical protein